MEQGLWRINFTLIWTRTLDVVTRSCFVYPEHFEYYWFFPNNKSMESKDCIQCALNLTEATNQIQQNMFPMKKKKITEWNRCCSYRKLIWCCFGKSSTISHDYFFSVVKHSELMLNNVGIWYKINFDRVKTRFKLSHCVFCCNLWLLFRFEFTSCMTKQFMLQTFKYPNIETSKHQSRSVYASMQTPGPIRCVATFSLIYILANNLIF